MQKNRDKIKVLSFSAIFICVIFKRKLSIHNIALIYIKHAITAVKIKNK